jgi:hypothetical protein
LDALPKGSKYHQDDVKENLLPALNQVRTENGRHKVVPSMMVETDNSMSFHGAKITEKLSVKGLG